MVVGRGGQLNLTASGQLAMERDHPGHQCELLVQKPLLLILGVVPPFRFELGELGVFLKQQGVHPGQVRPDLKVAQVASTEPRERLLGGATRTTTAARIVRGIERWGRIIESANAMKKLSRM